MSDKSGSESPEICQCTQRLGGEPWASSRRPHPAGSAPAFFWALQIVANMLRQALGLLAVLCAAACGTNHIEARAPPAWLPSVGCFNAAYFLLLALLKHRMPLVHRHGAPLLLNALRGMLRALGASQLQSDAAALDGALGGEAQLVPAGATEPPRGTEWAGPPLRLPLECTRHVARLLEEVAAKAHRKSCPERVVTMADAVTMVSKRKILNLPLSTWQSLEKLLSDRDPAHEQMLAYGWHLLFGQPAVLTHRSMSRH